MKKNKGFTLIELLVVIAIIGILAGIVLVALGGARTRARDARVITDLNQIRSTAELINSTDGNYSGVLTNGDINNLMADMNAQGATSILRTGNAAEYCVEAQLPGGRWGCVNSGLTARFDLANNPACSANNSFCQ
jgi:prepilin-type N-terminal cleavage/methylation domain-containing protein